MIDEGTAELLSRLLDGDLEPHELASITKRLETEPELEAELEQLRRLKHATRALAGTMEPPEALDDLIEPLRRGTPHAPSGIRPVVRWAGMAAGVVLAVTVAMEVVRRSPAPTPDPPANRAAPSAPGSDKGGIYQLKPLPTSPIPPEEELVGATERLLASPPAEPVADEPEPLDVRGPLPMADNEARSEVQNGAIGAEADRLAAGGVAAVKTKESRDAVTSKRARAAAGSRQVAAPPAAREGSASENTLDRGPGVTRLVLSTPRGVRVGEISHPGAWPAEAPPVEVTVADGVIVAEGPLGAEKDAEMIGESTGRTLVGSSAAGIPDGRYVVTVAVDDPE